MMEEPAVYTIPPLDYAPKLHVASCCCTYEGRFLLLQNAEHKTFAGTWGAPGGKIEPDETPYAAALRETFEETGLKLDPEAVHFFKTFYVRYPTMDFTYHLFFTELSTPPQEITLQTKEHSAYLWASREEIVKLPLIPGAYVCFAALYGDPLQFGPERNE